MRALLIMLCLAVPGTAAAAEPARPFGSHRGAARGGDAAAARRPAALDGATADAYDAWAGRYLEPGCAQGQLRVRAAPGAPAHVVSEGQGYGLVIVALMAGHDPAARERFDGLARYLLAHPSHTDARLTAWAQDARCRDVQGAGLRHGRRPRRRVRAPARRRAVGLGRRGRLPRRGAADARRHRRGGSASAHAPPAARRLDLAGRAALLARDPAVGLDARPPAGLRGRDRGRRAGRGAGAPCCGWRAGSPGGGGLLPDFVVALAARAAGLPRGTRRRALLVERVPDAVAAGHRGGADRRGAGARGGPGS